MKTNRNRFTEYSLRDGSLAFNTLRLPFEL